MTTTPSVTTVETKPRVLVAMSGGVDSSAVCLLLQDQGYEVVGMTMRVYDLPRQFEDGSDEPDFIRSARELAARSGIEPVSYTHLTLPTT